MMENIIGSVRSSRSHHVLLSVYRINQSLNLHPSQISKMFAPLTMHSSRLRLVVMELRIQRKCLSVLFKNIKFILEFLFAEREVVVKTESEVPKSKVPKSRSKGLGLTQ